MKKYYTLAIRESGQWGAQFGDYDRDVVLQEIEDCYSDVLAKNRKIILTGTSHQAIDAAIAALNGKD